MTALHTLYARPFKQKKQIRLTDDIVPSESKSLHDSIILMRDKIHSHTDLNGPGTSGGLCINKVVVRSDGQTAIFAATMIFPRNTPSIRDLADVLLKKCSYHSEKIWRRVMPSGIPFSGEFEININEGDDRFIKPLTW